MDTPQPQTTIVSCYYALHNNKKRSLESYQAWISTFLQACTNPIVMFSDGPVADSLDAYRKSISPEHAKRWLLIRRPYESLPFTHSDWASYWQTMLEQNTCRSVYQTEIFILYANKTKFLKEVILLNPFQTPTFYWCDAGCWRHPDFALREGPGWPHSPSPTRLQLSWVSNLDACRRAAEPLHSLEEFMEHLPVRNQVTVGGAMFGGPAQACLAFCDTVSLLFDLYRKHQKYGSDDQCILATAGLFLERAQLVDNIPPSIPPPGGDEWFALQYYRI